MKLGDDMNKIYMGYIKTIFFFSFLFPSVGMFSQYAWDIDYILVDSVGLKDVGKEVKFDFSNVRKPDFGKHYRASLSRKDTATIIINNQNIWVVERRTINADWGRYAMQYIESFNQNRSDTILKLMGSIIKEVKDNSILFETNVEIYRIKKKKKTFIETKVIDIWIEKDKLTGVFFERKG
jgi:hypothetical protein